MSSDGAAGAATGTDGAGNADERCVFCGRSVQGRSSEGGYCSDGCATVADTLGVPDDAGPSDDGSAEGVPEGEARTFLRVDGMYSANCEAFLERVASREDGVSAAEASYVTETVRVDHDPAVVSAADLAEALSVLGYDATPAEAVDSSPADTGDDGVDDVLGFRYAAGVLFGSFLMLPYVVVLYPNYALMLPGVPNLLNLPGASGFGGPQGPLVLPVFLVISAVVVLFTGAPLLRGAYVALVLRRGTTDLMVATVVVGAYLYSVATGLLGRPWVYYDLAVLVAAGVVAASYYESVVKRRALSELTDLTVSRVSAARRYEADGSTTTVSVDDLRPGDRVLVRGGERVPVDGRLVEDECTVDEAVVTGESTPVHKRAGDDLVGGSVVTRGAAVIEVGADSERGIDRLTRAVRAVQSATHGVQRRADRLAALVTPGVVGLAVLAGSGSYLLAGDPALAVVAALVVPVVASPWALGLATPLSVASSIRQATERGIVVFDETVFERIRGTDTVVFDKTGTLTTGTMEVLSADAPDGLLAAAAALERRSGHPAAEAIVDAFGGDDVAPTADGTPTVDAFTAYPTGVGGEVDGRRTLVGNRALFEEQGWTVPADLADSVDAAREAGHLPVLVGRDGAAGGLVVVGDELRDGWRETLAALADRGLSVVVLTGDSRAASAPFVDSEHVDHVFAEVPPEGKTATVRRLQADGRVTMVGDGTNDAPALAQADLGVSLGGGTALAAEAADLTIAADDPSLVGTAFDLADASRRRLRTTTGLALLYNVVTIPLAAVGQLNPLLVLVTVLVTAGLIVASADRSLLE